MKERRERMVYFSRLDSLPGLYDDKDLPEGVHMARQFYDPERHCEVVVFSHPDYEKIGLCDPPPAFWPDWFPECLRPGFSLMCPGYSLKDQIT
jgi:hypothetical protein